MKLSPLTSRLLLAGALTFSVTAFAQDDATPTTAPAATPALTPATSTSETPGTATAKPSPSTAKWTDAEKKFAMTAAGGNLAEVKMGELASTKATNEEVKSFGSQMVTDHGKANTDLEAVLTKKGMPFAPKLTAKQQADMDKLAALNGAAFDKAYVKGMLKDHVMDVAEYKAAAKMSKDEDLKNYQTTTLPVLEHHLMMVKDLSKKQLGAAK